MRAGDAVTDKGFFAVQMDVRRRENEGSEERTESAGMKAIMAMVMINFFFCQVGRKVLEESEGVVFLIA